MVTCVDLQWPGTLSWVSRKKHADRHRWTMKRLLMGGLLLATWTPALAVTLDPDCYRYYEVFNAEGLTYEEVGQVADKMHEKNCWPALQGLLDAEPPAPTEAMLPPITDCNSLIPHVVQMTVEQETEDKPAMMKLSSVEQVNMQAVRMACLELMMPSAFTDEAKAGVEEYCGKKGEGVVLECDGTARFPDGKKRVRFYLERDEDGDEFIGYSTM